jgi:hypothetical protein
MSEFTEGGVGEVRRLAPGLADGVAELDPAPRRASCLDRLRMTSDFIEEGRFSPCNFKLRKERAEEARDKIDGQYLILERV